VKTKNHLGQAKKPSRVHKAKSVVKRAGVKSHKVARHQVSKSKKRSPASDQEVAQVSKRHKKIAKNAKKATPHRTPAQAKKAPPQRQESLEELLANF
jgi:hypothetical protein